MSEMPKVNYDEETKKWLKSHLGDQTTVCMCSTCGLFYKPSLGHKCIRSEEDENT